MACPEGYSGWAGVGRSGSQFGSAASAALPALSALRIAVTGLQKLYRYLASQHAMYASAPAMLSSANSRAFSIMLLPLWAATCCAAMLSVTTPEIVQNLAASV